MNEVKRQIANINLLINDEEFLRRLCAFFNNNVENVDKALSLIIIYYLTTLDPFIDYTIEELMKLANRKYDNNFLFAQVDCLTAKHIKLFGINNSITEGAIPLNLQKTATAISFDPIPRNEELLFTQNPHKAITDLKPRALYATILKEPKGEEKAVSITEPERKHYTTIMSNHISRITRSNTAALITEGKKIINKYIDTRRHIVVVSRDHKAIDLGRAVGAFEAIGNIYPPSIGFIELPSVYGLKQICLENNMPDVEKSRQTTKGTREKYLVSYYRFEPITIDDKFEYFNNEVTGDADYDVDLLYAGYLSRDSKNGISSVFDENLRRIKKSTELIQLTKYGDKYEIINGRHRLIYLKHMYSIMTDPKVVDRLKREDFSIPALINHGIENDECNQLLQIIRNRHRTVKLLKDNVNDDEVNVIIIIDDRVYRVGNIEELKEFVYSLHQEKYFVGINSKVELDYEYIVSRIIFNKKGEYKNLSFIDIIRILKEQGIEYHGTLLKTDSLDYQELHTMYMSILANLERCKIFYDNNEIMSKLETKLLEFDISQDILSFIQSYPENMELNPFELVKLLQEDERFNKYSLDQLNGAIRSHKINVAIYERNKRIRTVPRV